jgi:hypothetical protein
MINWHVSKNEHELIEEIARRAVSMAAKAGIIYPARDAIMDLTAAHANAFPLDLADLLKANDFNFAHDVFGIRRHLDRNTGKLLDCFVPRYARRAEVA